MSQSVLIVGEKKRKLHDVLKNLGYDVEKAKNFYDATQKITEMEGINYLLINVNLGGYICDGFTNFEEFLRVDEIPIGGPFVLESLIQEGYISKDTIVFSFADCNNAEVLQHMVYDFCTRKPDCFFEYEDLIGRLRCTLNGKPSLDKLRGHYFKVLTGTCIN